MSIWSICVVFCFFLIQIIAQDEPRSSLVPQSIHLVRRACQISSTFFSQVPLATKPHTNSLQCSWQSFHVVMLIFVSSVHQNTNVLRWQYGIHMLGSYHFWALLYYVLHISWHVLYNIKIRVSIFHISSPWSMTNTNATSTCDEKHKCFPKIQNVRVQQKNQVLTTPVNWFYLVLLGTLVFRWSEAHRINVPTYASQPQRISFVLLIVANTPRIRPRVSGGLRELYEIYIIATGR